MKAEGTLLLGVLAALGNLAGGDAPPQVQTARPVSDPASPTPPPAEVAQNACDTGDGAACARVAEMYRQADGVPKDNGTAAVLLTKACEAKQMQACFDLADMHWRGEATAWRNLKRGEEAFEAGVTIDKARALALHLEACEAGNAAACRRLGHMYAVGVGIGKDEARAAELLRKACAGADELGCHSLGSMYASGRGAPQNDATALRLFQEACDAGDASACGSAGWMYSRGLGTTKDEQRAVGLFGKACEGGDPRGCGSLAFMCRYGKGTPKDEARAVELYQKACDGGDTPSCSLLADAYLSGRGVARDRVRAVAIHQRACDDGDAVNCYELGELYREGWETADKEKAVELYQRACDGGYSEACGTLGDMYADARGVRKDLGKAAQLLLKGCDGGHADSCFRLGLRYERGTGLTQDGPRAVQLFQRACDSKHADGCFRLGLGYEHGKGVTKDLVKAALMYQRACAAGKEYACNTDALAAERRAKDLATAAQSCEDGDTWGCFRLAAMYAIGRGVAKDESKASQLYQKACHRGYSGACQTLGAMYAAGSGVPKDATRATELSRKACEGKNLAGCLGFPAELPQTPCAATELSSFVDQVADVASARYSDATSAVDSYERARHDGQSLEKRGCDVSAAMAALQSAHGRIPYIATARHWIELIEGRAHGELLREGVVYVLRRAEADLEQARCQGADTKALEASLAAACPRASMLDLEEWISFLTELGEGEPLPPADHMTPGSFSAVRRGALATVEVARRCGVDISRIEADLPALMVSAWTAVARNVGTAEFSGKLDFVPMIVRLILDDLIAAAPPANDDADVLRRDLSLARALLVRQFCDQPLRDSSMGTRQFHDRFCATDGAEPAF